MTPDRDRIAELLGWKQDPECSWGTWERGEPDHLGNKVYSAGSRYGDHPIPATLDGLAACVPERFKWSVGCDRIPNTYRAVVWVYTDLSQFHERPASSPVSALTAALRAALEAEKEKNQ